MRDDASYDQANLARVLENEEKRRLANEKLNAALAKAQGSFPSIARSKSVTVETRTGGKFEYDYAPLETIMPAIRGPLAENGLAVVQLLEKGPSLRTELRHAEGGVLSSSFPFTAPDSPQALGSAITYIRRYALVAMLGLVTEGDDDAASAELSPSASGRPEGESITAAQNKKIAVLLKELETNWPTQEGQKSYVDQLREDLGVKSRKDLSKDQASRAIELLEGWKDAAGIPFG